MIPEKGADTNWRSLYLMISPFHYPTLQHYILCILQHIPENREVVTMFPHKKIQTMVYGDLTVWLLLLYPIQGVWDANLSDNGIYNNFTGKVF